METETTFYRAANVPKSEALTSLLERFPKADVVSFTTKKASEIEAKENGLAPGALVYAATVRQSEFPPPPSGGDEGGNSGDSEAPSDAPDEAPDEAPSEEAPSDEAPEGEEKPKKMAPAEQTNHLLEKILHVLEGQGGGAGPDDLGPMDDVLPDVGAPPSGGTLPPPGKAPLPPPVKPKAPMGGPAFSHYDPDQAEVATIRREANSVPNSKLVAEAAEAFPTHRVAKITRTGSATLNGKRYNLPENNIAVVTLVRK